MRGHKTLFALAALVSLSMASHDYIFVGGSDTTLEVRNSGSNVAVSGRSDYVGVVGEGGFGVIGKGRDGGGTGVIGTADYLGVSGFAYQSNAYWSIYGGSMSASNGGVAGSATGLYSSGGGNSSTDQAIGVNGEGYSGYESYGGKFLGSYGEGSTYGIYADAYSGNGNVWAGWFNGDVVITGSCCSAPSDIMFKKNVKPLTGGLERIMALRPKTYEMKTEEFKGRINLPKGPQFGLIAQEAEIVVPELVSKKTAPAVQKRGKDGKLEDPKKFNRQGTEFKAVDYMGLIPVLIQAIQEQEAKIASLQAELRKVQGSR